MEDKKLLNHCLNIFQQSWLVTWTSVHVCLHFVHFIEVCLRNSRNKVSCNSRLVSCLHRGDVYDGFLLFFLNKCSFFEGVGKQWLLPLFNQKVNFDRHYFFGLGNWQWPSNIADLVSVIRFSKSDRRTIDQVSCLGEFSKMVIAFERSWFFGKLGPCVFAWIKEGSFKFMVLFFSLFW